MNDLLKSIDAHKEKNNIAVCYRLYKFILNYKIDSLESLKKIENIFFNTDNIKIRNDIKYNAYLADATHHDKLDSNDISELTEYEKLYLETEEEILKTKYLILIYEKLNWQMCFPYLAYKLIINDKLN